MAHGRLSPSYCRRPQPPLAHERLNLAGEGAVGAPLAQRAAAGGAPLWGAWLQELGLGPVVEEEDLCLVDGVGLQAANVDTKGSDVCCTHHVAVHVAPDLDRSVADVHGSTVLAHGAAAETGAAINTEEGRLHCALCERRVCSVGFARE